ncbi:FtsQ-type POTRA domain-containing protein [Patescibacteria group bacterium]|nr:FtsQ-type POTRA domain-containing protein [Patescibacteria group bacterium]
MIRKDLLEASRKKKKRIIIIRLALIFFLILIIIALVVWSFYLNYFRIKNIEIFGNSFIEKEKIIGNINSSISGKYFYLIPKDNILITSKKEIINNLQNNFLRIKSTDIIKELPDKVIVTIKEREPVALLCEDKKCFFIDDSGYVFEESPFFSGDVFIKFIDKRENVGNLVSDGKLSFRLIPEDEFRNLINFLELLSKDGIKISDIILKNEDLYELYTIEGWYILLSKRIDFTIAFDNLKITLNSQIKEKRLDLEYIDLRLENKVFFKYKD